MPGSALGEGYPTTALTGALGGGRLRPAAVTTMSYVAPFVSPLITQVVWFLPVVVQVPRDGALPVSGRGVAATLYPEMPDLPGEFQVTVTWPAPASPLLAPLSRR